MRSEVEREKQFVSSLMLHHVREFKKVLDSGFSAMDSGFQALDSSLCQWNLILAVPIVNGIPGSLSCIPDSKTQDFVFHRQSSLDFFSPNYRNGRHQKFLQLLLISSISWPSLFCFGFDQSQSTKPISRNGYGPDCLLLLN